MKKLITLEEFKALNVGFVLDEGELKEKSFFLIKNFSLLFSFRFS
jgi:hypothetical protein